MGEKKSYLGSLYVLMQVRGDCKDPACMISLYSDMFPRRMSMVESAEWTNLREKRSRGVGYVVAWNSKLDVEHRLDGPILRPKYRLMHPVHLWDAESSSEEC